MEKVNKKFIIGIIMFLITGLMWVIFLNQPVTSNKVEEEETISFIQNDGTINKVNKKDYDKANEELKKEDQKIKEQVIK